MARIVLGNREGTLAVRHGRGVHVEAGHRERPAPVDQRHRPVPGPARGVEHGTFGVRFEVIDEGVPAGKCSIKVPGDHNVLNALAVIALLKTLGIPVSDLLPVMAGFKGVGRRLEIRGRYGDILFIDDYAHHPSEIRASAQALRMSYASGGRLVILFQPHRYSRVRDCFAEFARCFEAADCVIVTDIYAASEEPIPGVDALSLCERIREQVPEVVYVPHELIMSRVPVLLQPGDCVCAMGAGDISALLTAVIGKIAVADQV